MVYLQNSGLGNIVNPLMSLATPEVYSIPMLLLIGWRGEPGKKDEPQHLVQGKATEEMLEGLKIPYAILPDYEEGAEQVLHDAKKYMAEHKGPYALLVRKRTFMPYKLEKKSQGHELSRESALKLVVEQVSEKAAMVGTTGMLSRELFELRAATQAGHHRDFLTVGSMGHASSIALGIALAQPEQEVVCLDGDGAFLMHMGAAATIGGAKCDNLKHIVINNGAHDSVGGQPTNCLDESFSLTQIALGAGYKHVASARTAVEVLSELKVLMATPGPAMLEIVVNKGSRKNLGRPTSSPIQNKTAFMNFLEDNAINAHTPL
ncbi:phosphonopyruvate decarboxylase [Sphaeroforma arctica JP610]|uniref:Phosphonopyruvate decarboxylase n=1 Tax=Sphaeroforma arctica JP610 TaxID=667725 RepID=A0A0L0G3I6_9EUKA|nr:phosphonopyruvate decarboxylase [Sphaeroforma arctica JP610]KNC83610.1 phosphonopyruvate decarboxylase [Sphaeroforma arctica JP610]|eukprot:XP_014157512.1 phosphonopyruvate decarboxylase [Sphaeroforma arctica JP610]